MFDELRILYPNQICPRKTDRDLITFNIGKLTLEKFDSLRCKW